MELELKHLAPYLPYKLQCHRLAETNNPQTTTLTGGIIGLWLDGYYLEFDPILHPLSDLTNNTEHIKFLFNQIGLKDNMHDLQISSYYNKVKEWTWINCQYTEIYDNYSDKRNGGFTIKHKSILNQCYKVVQYLIQNHYDVFGLIPAGLAIDINSIAIANDTEIIEDIEESK